MVCRLDVGVFLGLVMVPGKGGDIVIRWTDLLWKGKHQRKTGMGGR